MFSKGETAAGRAEKGGGSTGSARTNRPGLFLISPALQMAVHTQPEEYMRRGVATFLLPPSPLSRRAYMTHAVFSLFTTGPPALQLHCPDTSPPPGALYSVTSFKTARKIKETWHSPHGPAAANELFKIKATRVQSSAARVSETTWDINKKAFSNDAVVNVMQHINQSGSVFKEFFRGTT